MAKRLFKYCLTYDCIDAEKIKNDPYTTGDNLKKLIVQTLKNEDAIRFKNPVASTITFFDNNEIQDFEKWLAIISPLKKYIFFYFCAVQTTAVETEFKNGWVDNKTLQANFDKLLDELKTNPFQIDKDHRLK